MPGSFTTGMEKQDGDPQTRCYYLNMKGGKFTGVKIMRFDGSMDHNEPVQDGATNVRKTTIDGRPGLLWKAPRSGDAWAAFGTGKQTAVVVYTDDAASDQQKATKAVQLAVAVSKGLRSSGPMSGAVTAPPTTSHEKVPPGTRAWPHEICEAMPQELLDETERARGFTDQRCRLTKHDDAGMVEYTLRRDVGSATDTATMGPSMRKESFDGRTAYSYLSDNTAAPIAYVQFDTGKKESATITVTVSPTGTAPTKEKVRADAVALAAEVAPKVPKP